MNAGKTEEVIARVNAAAKSGSVKIVAATKTVEPARINELKSLGITAIGENRVQELLSKYDQLDYDEIHFIGALQTNKVKYIVDKVCCIQSLDRKPLALEIEKRCAAIGKTMSVLIEVNIGEEAAKSGVTASELFGFIESVKNLSHLSVDGLMSVLPIGAGEGSYAQMRQLFDESRRRFGGMKYLSMGMSDDFERAINCGANMVRLGSILFGARPTRKGV